MQAAPLKHDRVSENAAPKQNRRTAIAQAALHLLGHHGSRGLTHRAIDGHLSLPEGTTSAYFRRREDLVGAAIRELFRADFDRFEQQIGPLLASERQITLDDVVKLYASMIRTARHQISPAEKLARYECFLLARRSPETNRLLMDQFDARQQKDQELFRRLGVPDPRTAAIRFGVAIRGAFFTLAFLPEPSDRLDMLDEHHVRREILAAIDHG